MSSCRDRQLGAMLHHYELGLLSDEDRLRFEAHLLECDNCYERLDRFEKAARLMRTDDSVRAAVSDQGEPVQSPASSWASSRMFRTVATLAAVVVATLFLNWRLEIGPPEELKAQSARLAVAGFGSPSSDTSSPALGEVVSSLLISDLTQVSDLQVVSSQRLRDLTIRLREEEPSAADSGVTLESARRSGARWLLTGGVQTDPALLVSAQLIDLETGDLLGAPSHVSDSGQDVFDAVDHLSREVRALLPLVMDDAGADRDVAEVTTHSVEAFRYYLIGLNRAATFANPEAIASFRRALEFDSTFAMAYYHLSQLENPLCIHDAVKHSESSTWKEQLYIEARRRSLLDRDSRGAIEALREILERSPDEKDAAYAIGNHFFVAGQYDSSTVYYRQTLALDARHKLALNQLAYAYSQLDILDSAIWAINRYVEVAPDEPNPYDSRGDLYAARGMVDEAIASFRAALRVRPDYAASVEKLAHMFVFKGEYERADSIYTLLESWETATPRSEGRNFLAYAPLRLGQTQKALEIVSSGIAANASEGNVTTQENLFRFKAMIHQELGEYDLALTALDMGDSLRALNNRQDPIGFSDTRVQVLAMAGRFDEAQTVAEELAERLRQAGRPPSVYHWTQMVIAWHRGDRGGALDWLRRYDIEAEGVFGFGRVMAATEIMVSTGMFEDVVPVLESRFSHVNCTQLFYGIPLVRGYYLLGVAYQEAGWHRQATEQYRKFLDLWQSADTAFPEIEDARQRLSRLESAG